MSYDYFDAAGFVAPGPSYTAQWALRKHLAPHARRYPSIAQYLDRGFTDCPRQLARDLSRLSSPSDPVVADRLRALRAAASRADATLILSDGIG